MSTLKPDAAAIAVWRTQWDSLRASRPPMIGVDIFVGQLLAALAALVAENERLKKILGSGDAKREVVDECRRLGMQVATLREALHDLRETVVYHNLLPPEHGDISQAAAALATTAPTEKLSL